MVHWYLRNIVARLGGAISGQREAYDYLAESASGFYSPQELSNLLRRVGFSDVRHQRLFAGSAALHVAIK
jgi:demethylmenaquinone methyltransferase/2-methoxy-6-polyprenyl-1,4-benzoquinol methylase